MASMMTGQHLANRYVEEHPGSTMTRNAIKCLLRSGCIPSVHAGNRRFFSYEAFLRFLEDGNDQPAAADNYGQIRRIM